jgi:hypothetical protein
MSRIFKRPMFRKGGPTNNMNGIMTGIVDRENHAVSDPNGVGSQTAMDYINRIIPTEAEMSAFRERMPRQKETSGLDDPLTSFLLSYGPALATAKPTGGIIGTAVGAAKEPIANLLKDVKEKKQLDYVTESDAFKTLLEAKADALSGAGSQKTYRDIIVNKEVERLVPLISQLTTQLEDESLTDADKIKIQNELESAKISLNNLKKSDPTGEALLEVFIKSPQGSNLFTNTISNLFKTNPEKYPGGKNDPKLLEDAVKDVRKFLTGVMEPRSGVKDGGRIQLQDGTPPVTEARGGGQDMSQNDNPISFDQLRARLPEEITNDIVTLMSNSAEALNDFASISTQQDVNNFNKKYNVNLVLPAEA